MNHLPSRNPSQPLSTSATPAPRAGEKSGRSPSRQGKTPRESASELLAINARLQEEIAEREKIEEALRKSDERYRTLIETVPVVIYGIDSPTATLNYLNLEFEAATGWRREEWLGKPFLEIVHPDDRQQVGEGFQKAIAGTPVGRHELRLLCKGGDYATGELLRIPKKHKGQIVGELGIFRDITEHKAMEEKFLRSQRMESIGALAGGIAHDLNNILGPIMMSASMLREPHTPDTGHELVSAIQEAAQRGANIVRQVLTYTRGTQNEHRPLNARKLIVQVEKILKEILSKSVTLSTLLPENLWNITGNPTRLQQVLVNLCVNARDAMPQGGRLSLEARNCEISPLDAAKIADAQAGRFVKIEVIDSGTGIPRDIIEKIFEPFFTTKEPGKGTGLGLSTVREIVKSHGGFITVDSQIGQGSKFSVYLPATPQAILPPAPSAPPHVDSLPKGQGQKVLVVDDELPICKMVETILKSKGYEAIKALNAHEALEVYAQQGSAIHAILTDVAMPDMDGVALTRKLKEINPSAVIIASTGQPLELRQKELGEMGIQHFLPKPYNAHQLLDIVQKALATAEPSPASKP